MASNDGAEPTTPNKHQHLYKKQTPNWKDSYRKRCMHRLKASREKAVGRFRQLQSHTEKEMCKAEIVEDVMKQEWLLMRGEPESGEADDMNGMLDIFSEIRAELLLEETQILAEYESSLAFEEEAAANAVAQMEMEEVICPVCQRNCLVILGTLIRCQCGVHIDMGPHCLTLSDVRRHLAEGSAAHSAICDQPPKFGVVSHGGIPNILMTCEPCDFMFIIV